MEDNWFYERLFFEVIFAIIKDKKEYCITDIMSRKHGYIHQM